MPLEKYLREYRAALILSPEYNECDLVRGGGEGRCVKNLTGLSSTMIKRVDCVDEGEYSSGFLRDLSGLRGI